MPTVADTNYLSLPALILLAHGARDARWREPFDQVCSIVRRHIADGVVKTYGAVEISFLEHMSPSFMIAAQSLYAAGYRRIVVAPLFLGVGGHVRSDVPKLIERVQLDCPAIDIQVKPPMAQSHEVLSALVAYSVADCEVVE